MKKKNMDFLKNKNIKPDYSNWIALGIPLTSGVLTVIMTGASVFTLKWSLVVGLVLALIAVGFCAFTIYMYFARRVLSYDGGGVQGKVLDEVLVHLDKAGFDGYGKLLDIGCGSGALSVKAAKKYPNTLIFSMDYWGKGWDYSQKLCEQNARAEDVECRISFHKGDAANLDYKDNVFDAAVSNFVFHEVRSQKDKHKLILEAIRVVKPGGYFAFQDTFFSKSHYGDINAFVDALRPYVSQIHFVDTRHPSYAPKFLSTPLVLGQMGMIYGRK